MGYEFVPPCDPKDAVEWVSIAELLSDDRYWYQYVPFGIQGVLSS